MATLEKIRNRAGLLVAIIIGLALLLFVVGDMLNSSQSLFTNSKFEIAKVAGKSISYDDFNRRVENLIEINKIQTGGTSVTEEMADNIRNSTWNLMIEEYIMTDEYDKLGLSVTGDELMDMIQGENPHPIIKQLFSNPQTGVYDKTAVYRFLQQVLQEEQSERKTIWLFYENEIYRQRKLSKYLNLLSKGIYVNNIQAKNRAMESGKTYDFEYLVQRFTSISDSSITVSDKEIEEYYKNNKYKYQQEESRDLRYVTFEVLPSDADYKAAEEWINNAKAEFEKEETKQFVNFQSDVPYDDMNYKDGELPEAINNFMFQSEEGSVFGPYFEDGAYKLSKLAEINYLPDSVHAQHILLQVTQENYMQQLQLADSLKKLAENGEDFAALARVNSSDGSAQEGGDLGWFKEGQMVKPFGDSAFYGNKGDIKMVRTQFGIHILKILDQAKDVKKVQVGTLVKKVEPSNVTDQLYYSKASEFSGLNNTYEKFNKAVAAQNLNVLFAQGVKPLDKAVLDLQNARELVKWAYESDEHEVSDVKKIGNKYIVAVLENVKEEGYTDLEDIREEIKIEVRKEKKAAQISIQIADKLKNNSSLNNLASSLETQVQSTAAVRFSNSSVTGLGFEPKVVAAGYALEENKLSQPITGDNGVYVISNTSVSEPSDVDVLKVREKMMMDRNYDRRVNYFAVEALKDRSEITDNRVKFF